MPDKQPKDERAWWRFVRTNTFAARKRRGFYDRRFKAMFPKGAESLKETISACIDGIRMGFLNPERFDGYFEDFFVIHPDALRIIEKYGTDYVGQRWDRPPPMPEPKKGACFWNAYCWANAVQEKYEVAYVEGIAHNAAVIPCHHAWNACGTTDQNALDWSWYAIAHWTRYRGIPLTVVEYRELTALTPIGSNIGLLFRKKNFTSAAKKRLIEILEKRIRDTKKRPKK